MMSQELNPVMNDTKWAELRLAMHALDPSPSYSTLACNGFRARPDREWYYHLGDGGSYDYILHLDIHVDTPEQRERVRSALQSVHVPGKETPDGFRIFGYLRNGQHVDYL